jgi:hypothetical protein
MMSNLIYYIMRCVYLKMFSRSRNKRKTRRFIGNKCINKFNKNKNDKCAKGRRIMGQTRRLRGGEIKFYDRSGEDWLQNEPMLVDNEHYKVLITNPNYAYIGEIKANVLHGAACGSVLCTQSTYTLDGSGKQRIRLPNGEIEVYDGEWKNDKKQGQGKFENLTTGFVYDGEWDDNKMQGHGTMKFYGFVYDGEWNDNKMQGHGIMKSADGSVYDGEWHNNDKHGHGILTLADGSVYDGEWLNHAKNGKGKMTWANGSVYDGDWNNNKMHGIGNYTDKNGKSYHGSWVNDTLHPLSSSLVNYFNKTRG